MKLRTLLLAGSAVVGLAGVANATNFDPTKIDADITLSSSNLKATHSGSTARDSVAEGTVFRSTGKYTFTFTVNQETALHSSIGFVNASAAHGIGAYLGIDANGFGVLDNGEVYQQGSLGSLGISYTNGSVVDVAVDLGAHQLWMRVNGGNWNGNASFAPGGSGGFTYPSTMGALTPATDIYTLNDAVTANFSNGPFGLSGYSAWDTAVALNGCSFEGTGANFNTWSCTLPTPTAAGDTLVVGLLGYYNNGSAPTDVVASVLDNKGDAFVKEDVDLTNSALYAQESWILPNATAGATQVTVTLNTGVQMQFPMMIVDDLGKVGALDAHGLQHTGNGSATTLSSSSITPSGSGDFIVSAIGTGAGTITAVSPYVLSQSAQNSTGATTDGSEYNSNAASGAQTSSFTVPVAPSTNSVDVSILAFKPASLRVTGLALSKATFAPNTLNATVGTVSATMSDGSAFAGTYAVQGNGGACGFHMSGTTLQSGAAANCPPGNYTDFQITATPTNTAIAPFSWCSAPSATCNQGGLSAEAQKISSIVLSGNGSFQASSANATIGSITVNMTPGSPAFSPAAPGNPGLQLTNIVGCSIVLNGTTIQAPAAGCTAGSTTFNIVATPSNTDIAALTTATQTVTAVANAAPPTYPVPLTYAPGISLTNLPVIVAPKAYTVTAISGVVTTPVGAGGTAALDIFTSPSGTPCNASATRLNATSPGFNADTPVNTVQNIAPSANNSVAAGGQICLVPNGSSEWPGAGLGNITLLVQ